MTRPCAARALLRGIWALVLLILSLAGPAAAAAAAGPPGTPALVAAPVTPGTSVLVAAPVTPGTSVLVAAPVTPGTSVLVAAPGTPGTPTTAVRAPLIVGPSQELAVILAAQVAYVIPDARSLAVGLVRTTRPVTGERTLLPVIGHATEPGPVYWLHVLLPGRPNGHAGWILRRGTLYATTSWHVVVELSARRVIVYRSARVVAAFRGAVVGKPATPTPTGEFFVEEAVALRAGDVGAPFALALSARSNVLQEFAGGPGQIALHGVQNIGGAPGTAVTHGCVRLPTQAVRWLAAHVGRGVPVTILA